MFLSEESYAINGAAMYVHQQLGDGFLEAVYQEALARTFEKNGIPYEREKPIQILFDGKPLAKEYIADFVCYGKIIVELKAVDKLTSQHISQTLNYLKATGYKLGLLYNFGARALEYKRLVN